MPIQPGNFRSMITRANANNNNAEIVNYFYWSINLTNPPRGVYYPGDQLFYQRLISVSSLPSSYSHQQNDVEVIGGFKNIQLGGVSHNEGTLSLTFQDYVDQSISYFWTDYMNKIDDPETRTSLPKRLLVMDADVFQLDSQLNPIKQFILKTGVPTSVNTGEDFTNQKSTPGGKVTVELAFEWWDVKYL